MRRRRSSGALASAAAAASALIASATLAAHCAFVARGPLRPVPQAGGAPTAGGWASALLPGAAEAADGAAAAAGSAGGPQEEPSIAAIALAVGALAALLGSGALDLYSRPPQVTQRAGGFRYYASRNKPNFNRAFEALAAEHPGFESEALLVYFCGYGGKTLPELEAADRYISCIEPAVTEELDDKEALARNLKAMGCERAFPTTFFSVSDALDGTPRGDSVFFLKPPNSTGGAGIELRTRDQLASGEAVPDGCVIQEAVRDLETIDGRKFVMRFFLLVHDGKLYLHRRGASLVHAKPYDPKSCDFDVQCHRSFSEGGARLLLSHEQPGFDARQAAIRRRVCEMLPALRQLLQASSEDRYIIIGGDALIEQSGEARLIELNMYPNLGLLGEFGRDFNLSVVTPMLKDMLAAMLVGKGGEKLPGPLNVHRRAPDMYHHAISQRDAEDDSGLPSVIMDEMRWVDCYALAAMEQNATMGRVVTAPTNGASGVVPAVLTYYMRHIWEKQNEARRSTPAEFLLTAAAVGILAKENACISGAAGGCQAEVGTAAAMAAAGLCAVVGGTPPQVEQAAEIALEHCLGMTCDPMLGLVQVPCIERNTMGANKALNAVALVMKAPPGRRRAIVSYDDCLRVMKQTGDDMHSRYRETAQGGLAAEYDAWLQKQEGKKIKEVEETMGLTRIRWDTPRRVSIPNVQVPQVDAEDDDRSPKYTDLLELNQRVRAMSIDLSKC